MKRKKEVKSALNAEIDIEKENGEVSCESNIQWQNVITHFSSKYKFRHLHTFGAHAACSQTARCIICLVHVVYID